MVYAAREHPDHLAARGKMLGRPRKLVSRLRSKHVADRRGVLIVRVCAVE
jgi:hypothetical protein